jgi:hypothetical protein
MDGTGRVHHGNGDRPKVVGTPGGGKTPRGGETPEDGKTPRDIGRREVKETD